MLNTNNLTQVDSNVEHTDGVRILAIMARVPDNYSFIPSWEDSSLLYGGNSYHDLFGRLVLL